MNNIETEFTLLVKKQKSTIYTVCYMFSSDPDEVSDNLATVSSIMARFKAQYDQWLHYVCPTIITPWLAWFCYEYTEAMGFTGTVRWCCVGFLLGCGLIGFVIGYSMHRRTVNLAEEVMRQIEE